MQACKTWKKILLTQFWRKIFDLEKVSENIKTHQKSQQF